MAPHRGVSDVTLNVLLMLEFMFIWLHMNHRLSHILCSLLCIISGSVHVTSEHSLTAFPSQQCSLIGKVKMDPGSCWMFSFVQCTLKSRFAAAFAFAEYKVTITKFVSQYLFLKECRFMILTFKDFVFLRVYQKHLYKYQKIIKYKYIK